MKKRIILAVWGALLVVATLAGCTSDAERVSENISKDADQFKIQRRVIFYNGITDKIMLQITGRCSIDPVGRRLDVTCKIGPNKYIKDYLGLSDNVTYFTDQLKPVDASVYHYKVILKPENIIPDFDVEMGQQ